uniref:Uncharacterized protein n=1 Tax=Sphaerodactylus townsendi TaxID=933632 RepID=A0ACB8G840_9SAUR
MLWEYNTAPPLPGRRPHPLSTMLRRLLDRPCTLALLICFQFAFMAYFSFGGFRNLAFIFGHDSNPSFDYSRTHDVYTNLSLLPQQPRHRSPTGALPYCPERSPYLSESDVQFSSEVKKGTGYRPVNVWLERV